MTFEEEMQIREERIKEMAKDLEQTGMLEGYSRCVIAAQELIDAGWSKQAWISVEERLPTEQDVGDDCGVIAIHKRSTKRYFHWRSVADNPFDFTHWMPLPEPPKGEEQ